MPQDRKQRRGAMTAPQRRRQRKNVNREQARLERKRAIAAGQITTFEDQLSGHELNLERLRSMPKALIGRSKADREGHEAKIAEEERSIKALKHAIAQTTKAAGDALELAAAGDAAD